MLSYEEAMEVMGELIDALPEGIFDSLNGGVMLLEDSVTEDDGTVTFGCYFTNELGRYIEIYYGSFVEAYGDVDDEQFRDRLKKTLHHELTHHIESLAGDRSLERWDERQAELYGFGDIDVHSILFVDDDCSALAPAAVVVFNREKTGRAAEVTVEAASVGKPSISMPSRVSKEYPEMRGVRTGTVTRELMEEYDVILCMTAVQAEAVSDKFDTFDDKIMCLAEDDIDPPQMALGWKKCLERLEDAVLSVIDELNLED